MSLDLFIGLLAVGIDTYGRYGYVKDILKGTTKPHAFTWFLWFILMCVGGSVSISQGAWIAGGTLWISGLQNLGVFFLALRSGEKNVSRCDGLTFIFALLAIPVWVLTKNALYAALIVSAIDGSGYYFTFKKAWSHPDEENAKAFFIFWLSETLRLAATKPFTLITALYSCVIWFLNLGLIFFILARRKRLHTTK